MLTSGRQPQRHQASVRRIKKAIFPSEETPPDTLYGLQLIDSPTPPTHRKELASPGETLGGGGSITLNMGEVRGVQDCLDDPEFIIMRQQ